MGNAEDVDIRNQITMQALARKIQAAAIPITALHPAVRHQAAIILLLTTAPQAVVIPPETIRQMATAATICPATAASRQRVVATTRQAALAAIYPVTATTRQEAELATVPQEVTTQLLAVRLPAAANPQPHRIQIPLLLPLQTAIRMP